MPRLFIMCGIPGSGKTYLANKYLKNNNVRYISRDEIRFSIIKENEEYFSHEKEVFKKFAEAIAQTLINGFDAIADATHLNHFSRDKLIRAIDQYITDYTIEYVVADASLDLCMKRNASREGRARVPDVIMYRMAKSFEDITNDERAAPRVWGTFHWNGVIDYE